MRFGVLGTGSAGRTLASRLVELGHDVRIGARDAANPRAAEWVAHTGGRGSAGDFAAAAEFGEMVINATAGAFSLDALHAVGEERLAGKVLLDAANPLDFSQGMPPRLLISNDDSLAERIQREFPAARVVKALNTINADVMVDPAIVPGSHTVFMCGDDESAKAAVGHVLRSFDWPADAIMDLGDLSAARGMEMYLPLWLRLWGATGTGHFNVKVVVVPKPAA